LFTRFRDWLKQQTPLDQPDLAEIIIKSVINDFGTVDETVSVSLPILTSTSISSDLALSNLQLCPDDLGEVQLIDSIIDNYYECLIEPIIKEESFSKLDFISETLNLLEALVPPRYAGKTYGEQDDGKKVVQKEIPFDPNSVDKTICKHGAPRYACAICDEEEEKRKLKKNPFIKKIKTINVFDLLLPFLQPPFEHMLDQPILFPPGLRPYDYQVEGIRFLVDHPSALLGDEMGLGKTIQTIIGMRILVRRRKVKKVLILCPLSLLGNWEREIKKWAPELIVLKVRGAKEIREWLWKSRSIVYLTTYETLRGDTRRNIVTTTGFNMVVLDEIQRIKNPESGISRAVRKLVTHYRWGLSGTPLENKIDDVIAIFRFLRPDVFERDREYSSYHVRQLIKPYFLRRRVQDVKDELPDKHVSEIWLDLNDNQRQSYDQLLEDAKTKLMQPGITRIHIFSLINQLKLICNMDPDTGDSCKIEYLQDQLSEIVDGGNKALVFSQFPNKTLAEIKEDLDSYSPEIFHGGLSEKQRERVFQDFQEEEIPKVLLASVKAAGIGLNLTRANHVFHFDHWWNPAIARQAEARAWRIGQALPVFVHDIYTNDTVEERIYQILSQKQALFDEVIDDLSSEYTSSSFSDEDLYKIFDLEMPASERKTTPASASTGSFSIDALKKLNPNQFEQLSARYFEMLGFVVNVTGGAHDKGVDISARRATELGVEQLIIQCKHYPESAIGPNIIREMIGTREIHNEATSATLITSGSFSDEAIRLANKHQIKLIDGAYLIALLRKHQIPIKM
jgi:SNF2 family DNA or RNA helicase